MGRPENTRSFSEASSDILEESLCGAQTALRAMILADASRYERSRDLPKALTFLSPLAEDHSELGTRYVIQKLCAAAGNMRSLGLQAHWSYDLNRHIAVLAALASEQLRLETLGGSA